MAFEPLEAAHGGIVLHLQCHYAHGGDNKVNRRVVISVRISADVFLVFLFETGVLFAL